MSIKTLAQLQDEHLPRMDWRKVEAITRSVGDAQSEILDAYFSRFLAPSETCIRCDSDLVRWFGWGIQHGVGSCQQKGCGYPARAYHYKLLDAGKLTMILQYHPDELRRSVPREPAEVSL